MDAYELRGHSKVLTQSAHPPRCFYLAKGTYVLTGLPDSSTSAADVAEDGLDVSVSSELPAGAAGALGRLHGYVHRDQRVYGNNDVLQRLA